MRFTTIKLNNKILIFFGKFFYKLDPLFKLGFEYNQ